MSGPSPRYVAEHFLFPAFLRAHGIDAVLRAIEFRDSQFFTPVWVEAGFRFTPNLMYAAHEGYRIGAVTFPTPRQITEAYMGVVIGRSDDPSFVRYFTWELSISVMDQSRCTVLGEWDIAGRHINHGPGPMPSGNLPTDVWQVVQAALQTIEPGRMLQ